MLSNMRCLTYFTIRSHKIYNRQNNCQKTKLK